MFILKIHLLCGATNPSRLMNSGDSSIRREIFNSFAILYGLLTIFVTRYVERDVYGHPNKFVKYFQHFSQICSKWSIKTDIYKNI